jgi:hypothetical protein
MFGSKLPKPRWRIWLARGIAIAADVLQVGLSPWTAEGAFSPINDGLDFVVAVILTLLVGWHIAFVPSFIVKLLPIADLAPTWTVAVFIATRGAISPKDDRQMLPGLDQVEPRPRSK